MIMMMQYFDDHDIRSTIYSLDTQMCRRQYSFSLSLLPVPDSVCLRSPTLECGNPERKGQLDG
jgi:hypothetical protein